MRKASSEELTSSLMSPGATSSERPERARLLLGICQSGGSLGSSRNRVSSRGAASSRVTPARSHSRRPRGCTAASRVVTASQSAPAIARAQPMLCRCTSASATRKKASSSTCSTSRSRRTSMSLRP